MIIRHAKIEAIWTCEDDKNSKWKMHYVNVDIVQTYVNRWPTEPFNEEGLLKWLDEKAYIVVKKMCERACESNCDSCYCDEDSVDFNIIEVPTQKGEIIELPPVKCPEAIVVLYIDTMKRLAGYKKQIPKLETKRDELRKQKLTVVTLKELKKTITELEHQLKMESADIDQITRIKQKCPDIEQQIKQTEKKKT